MQITKIGSWKLQTGINEKLDQLSCWDKNQWSNEQQSNNVEAMSSRVNDTEWISGLKVRIMKNTQSEQETERIRGKKSNLWDPWDNTKRANLCIICVPEGEERKGLKMYLM